MDTDSSFELIRVSEVSSEPELRTNRVDTTRVEIEDLQANEFAINFKSLLTDLKNPMIIQVRPLNSPAIGVPMRKRMASAREIPSTST